ncbi:MAG TPA: cbb3-type cytochrome c oxidase N-terminal domain-containing protein [Kofleriaceae bacterium]|nr:cbb3-type cytochrome c oxidase N-terminal domain-containing protein [Kofleriaceae bacterium]
MTADQAVLNASPSAAPEAAVPDEESADARLMEHDYDGIREYDNPLPSWWSIVFGATIAFAFLYFAYFNIAGWGRSPAERYQVALAGWQATYKGGPGGAGGPSVTEDMLAAGAQNSEVVARGAEVFASRCTGCHMPDGRGQIGPNLTDLYQIHGDSRMDIYGTIVGGAPGTAMIAWGEVMKPTELIAVATFVTTLRGKNLPGKEPQGKPVPALAR